MEEHAERKVIIKLDQVYKSYGDNQVVKNLNFDIFEGEFITFLGPSGCGKTTTLRMIAGFEELTEGKILLDGTDVVGVPPYLRDVNTVFQSYALFPHMNLFDNVAFGLVEKKMKKAEIKEKVKAALELVQLNGFEQRMPNQISGGQKQRVAIARALVNNPKVLLLDEPLGALDLKLRKQMQEELKHLQKKLGITFIYVTHDQEEALTMSDRIVVMNNGIVEQSGSARDIYERPRTRFVAEFIGESNLLEGYVTKKKEGTITLTFESGDVTLKNTDVSFDEMVYVSIRPEHCRLSRESVENFNLVGVVKETIYVGSTEKTVVQLANGQEVKVSHFPDESLMEPGEMVYLYWKEGKAVIMHTIADKIYDLIDEAEVVKK